VALWHLDEGAGSVAHDGVGGHDAVFVGDPVWTSGYPFTGDVVPDSDPPAAPSNVSVDDMQTGGALRVSWLSPSDLDLSHCRVYRSNEQGVLGTLVADLVKTDVFEDAGLESGATYHYTVHAVDMSGNESTNTDQHAGVPSGLPQNLALQFDSTDDMAVVPSAPIFNTPGPLTIEAWIRIETMPTSNAIIASRWDGTDRSWSLYYSSNGRAYFLVRGSDGVQSQAIAPAGTLARGVWYHVAGVADPDANQLRIYVNGVRRANRSFASPSLVSGSARLSINGYPAGSAGEGLGHATIDEVRLSDSARYVGGGTFVPAEASPSDGNTLGLWHFDEAAGTKIFDSSSYGNLGSILGDPEWVIR
jgi:hypothetical protein